ncbi:MAG: SpoIIE family protein phosphatase [Rhodocyclaceae bacterium]|nr:SpoIIE family protein phosphatase [Rhodocyclaceae bacterium]
MQDKQLASVLSTPVFQARVSRKEAHPDDELPLRQMRILVADDSGSSRTLLAALIERMGHVAYQAKDGFEAVEMCQRHVPDLVLLDVIMPGMDGFEALVRIRALPFERWIPVVFLTALGGDESVTRALMEGGDDYLQKPIQLDVFKAKLHAIGRALQWQDEVLAQRVELSSYRDRAEEEKRFARRLMEMLSKVGRIEDPAISILSQPAEQLNGDVVAAARTPDGKLHVLLADGTGHGLAAALNVLPTIEPFYSMTSKGFALTTILSELNRKLYSYLPRECYVAASMVVIDPIDRRLEVWNGGMPDVLIVERRSGLTRHQASRNLPLGIIRPEEFDPVVAVLPLEADALVLLASDGLIEALGDMDLAEGLARLSGVVARSDPDLSVGQVVAHITTEPRCEIDDDLTLLVVDCGVLSHTLDRKRQGDLRAVTRVAPTGRWRLEFSLDAHQLRTTDVVPVVHGFAQSIGLDEEAKSSLFVVLSELFNNALDHGLLAMSTERKDTEDDLEHYFGLREQRLAQLEDGSVAIAIEKADTPDGAMLELIVTDSGAGFDPSALDQHNAVSRGGRGINLVRAMCEEFEFRGTGNVAVARLRIGREAGS